MKLARRVGALALGTLLLGATACQEPAVVPERASIGAGSPEDVQPAPVEPDSVTYEVLGDPRFNAQEPFAGPDGKPFPTRLTGHRNVNPGRDTDRGEDHPLDRGLRYLASTQRRDGSWDGGSPVGDLAATGAAALALLGYGETHISGAHKHTVKRAMRYIKTRQAPDGGFGKESSDDARLARLLATAALLEAYGITESRLFRDQARSAGKQLIAEVESPDFTPSDDPFVALWQTLVLRCYETVEFGATGAVRRRLVEGLRPSARVGDDWIALGLFFHELATDTDAAADRRADEQRRTLFSASEAADTEPPSHTSEQLFLRLVTLMNDDEGRSKPEVDLILGVRSRQVEDAGAPLHGSWPVTSERGRRFGRAYATALGQMILNSWLVYPRPFEGK